MRDVHLCISDLLDQDMSSFEYFQSLPKNVRDRLMELDVRTFEDLQEQAGILKEQEAAR